MASMEGSQSTMGNISSQTNNKKVQGKVKWDLALVIIFCDVCKKQINDGNRQGGGLKQFSWKTIATKFNSESGLCYDGNIMKNKWDSMKKDWKNWRTLKRVATGLGWSSQKGTIDASDDWWEKSIKANPEIKKFRTKGIPPEVEEKLDGLFLGAVAKGDHMWSPSAGYPPRSFFEASVTETIVIGDTPTSVEDLHTDSTSPHQVSYDYDDLEEIRSVSEAAGDLVKKRPNVSSAQKMKQSSKKMKGGASMLSAQIGEIKEDIKNHKDAIMARVNKQPPTISDAVEVLLSMENDVQQFGELYRFGTKLLLNKEKREMFMALKTYSARLWYLKSEASEAEESSARSFSSLIGSQQYNFSS